MTWPKNTYLPTYLPTYPPTYLCTFIREHPKGAILETCDLWDIWSEWWGGMTWPTSWQIWQFSTIFEKNWQLLTNLTTFDNFWQIWQFWQFLKKLTIFDTDRAEKDFHPSYKITKIYSRFFFMNLAYCVDQLICFVFSCVQSLVSSTSNAALGPNNWVVWIH